MKTEQNKEYKLKKSINEWSIMSRKARYVDNRAYIGSTKIREHSTRMSSCLPDNSVSNTM